MRDADAVRAEIESDQRQMMAGKAPDAAGVEHAAA